MKRAIPLRSSPDDSVIREPARALNAALRRVAATANSSRTRELFSAMADGRKFVPSPAERSPAPVQGAITVPEPRRSPPARPTFQRPSMFKK